MTALIGAVLVADLWQRQPEEGAKADVEAMILGTKPAHPGATASFASRG